MRKQYEELQSQLKTVEKNVGKITDEKMMLEKALKDANIRSEKLKSEIQ